MSTSRSVVEADSFIDDVRLAWRERRDQQRAMLAERRDRAGAVALAMAAHLKSVYDATRVVLFGTTVTGSFHACSDIDIAAWGISDDDWSLAYGDIAFFDAEFEGDLVGMEHCKPHIAEEISRSGVEL